MRTLVWILILINVGIWTFFNQDFFYAKPSTTAQVEIDPDKMHLLTQHQLNALPKNTPEPTPTVTAQPDIASVVSTSELTSCYEWGLFSGDTIADAQTTASKLLLPATLKEHSSSDAKRYWVYLPKLKNAQAAQEKAAELKGLGVNDLYVMQDPKWKNAISFGIFEDEQLAANLLQELQAKGIKNATKAIRNQGAKSYSLMIKDVSVAGLDNLKAVKTDFPDATIKEVSCN
jgi:hypothetical protein